MKLRTLQFVSFLLCFVVASTAISQTLPVIGGQTNVFLGTTQEEMDNLTAAGLMVTGINGDTTPIPGGVAFPIDPSSTFLFTPGSVAPVAGSIEHSGTVLLDSGLGPLELGDFSIGFNVARVDGGTGATGFFVADTFNPLGPLFDLANLSVSNAGPSGLEVGADLLVSPELAMTLGNTQLTGADVGNALVDAQVPEPSSILLVSLVALAMLALPFGQRG